MSGLFFIFHFTCNWIWLEIPQTLAVLNIISKPDFKSYFKNLTLKLILNTHVNLGSQIANLITEVKDMLAHSKKLETNVAIVSNVNNTLVKRVVATERQCWGNA